MPYLLLLLLIFINFFIYGSGAAEASEYEKQKNFWVAMYIVLALTHLLAFYRYLNFLNEVKKSY